MKRTIYTHFRPDLDAAAAVWAVRRYVPEMRGAAVEFRPAGWDGSGFRERNGDWAVDINAGGNGFKGEIREDGTVGSAFAGLMVRLAPEDHRLALAPVIEFIDTQDSRGDAYRYLLAGYKWKVPDAIRFTGLNAVFRALADGASDAEVVRRFGALLDGFLATGLRRLEAIREADRAVIIRAKSGGGVAILPPEAGVGASMELFDRAVIDAVVFRSGHNLGVSRRSDVTCRMDHPAVRAVVKEANPDELPEWFAHPSGFLFCRGSFKSPAKSPSSVDPRALAEGVLEALKEHRAQQRSGGDPHADADASNEGGEA